MTPLVSSLLELDREASAFAAMLGQSDRAKRVKDWIRAVRRAASGAIVSDLAVHPDRTPPAEAVRLVVEHALRAGLEFPEIVGVVNSVSERDCGVRS